MLVSVLSDASSLAAQSIIDGPGTLAPPSFEGMGWLVVVNLATMTFGFLFASALGGNMLHELWVHRKYDHWRHPVSLWRWGGFLIGSAGTLRFGAEALVLWGWDPMTPDATAFYTTLKRFFDPVAAAMVVTFMALFKLSERGMIQQLRRRPLPIDMWASLPMLKKPAIIAGLSLAAAVGVVSLR